MNSLDRSYLNASPHEQSFYNVGGQSEEFASEFFNEGRKQIEERNTVISHDDEGSFQIWESVLGITEKIYKHFAETLLISTTLRVFSKSHNKIEQILPQDTATKLGTAFIGVRLIVELNDDLKKRGYFKIF